MNPSDASERFSDNCDSNCGCEARGSEGLALKRRTSIVPFGEIFVLPSSRSVSTAFHLSRRQLIDSIRSVENLRSLHVVVMRFEKLRTDRKKHSTSVSSSHLAVAIVQSFVFLFHIAFFVFESSDVISGVFRFDFEDLHDGFETLEFLFVFPFDLFDVIFGL